MNDWILVKDRLPDTYDTVLITIREDWGEGWEYHVDCGNYEEIHKCWYVFNDWEEGQPFEIIAWQPLPEPYLLKD